jgi:hypothetical protein
MLTCEEYEPLSQSHTCRAMMWLYSTSALSMLQSNPGFVTELSKIKPFANPSFVQIELDYPRLIFQKHSRSNEAANH